MDSFPVYRCGAAEGTCDDAASRHSGRNRQEDAEQAAVDPALQ